MANYTKGIGTRGGARHGMKNGLYPNDTRTTWPGLPICIYADAMTDEQMLACLVHVWKHDPVFLRDALNGPAAIVSMIDKIFNAQAFFEKNKSFRLKHRWLFDLPTDHRENVQECLHRILKKQYDPVSILARVQQAQAL